MTGKEFVIGLRRMADWYEVNPDFPQPGSCSANGIFTVFAYSPEEFIKLKDGLGSSLLEVDNYCMRAFKSFGDTQLCVYAIRSSVCKKRVVGTKMVTERVATQWTDKEVEQDIVEWDCPPELQPAEPEDESGI